MGTPAKGTSGGLVPIQITKPVNGKVDKLYFTYAPSASEKFGAGDVMALSSLTFGK